MACKHLLLSLSHKMNQHWYIHQYPTLPQLHCPSLDLLQHLSVLLVVRGPKMNSVQVTSCPTFLC